MIKKTVHAFDAWLWRRGFHHPHIRAIALAEVLLALLALFAGLAFFPFSFWPLTFAVGLVVFAWNFYGSARFLLRQTLTAYSSGLLMVLLIRFSGRLLLTAVVLYVALIVYNAPVIALVCGLVAGMTVALVTYALTGLAGHNRKEA
ncbi:MAG: hypothetical protein RRY29_00815 [Desulfovibrionaceae bacterium]